MQVDIKVIPHEKQRYNTIGDWWFGGVTGDIENLGKVTLNIRVSAMDDWRYEMAVALHEQYEAMLCYARGISDKEVTDFDLHFEASPAKVAQYEEPGDDPSAPYYAEHAKALVVEHMFLADTDVVRSLYNEAMDSLYRGK